MRIDGTGLSDPQERALAHPARRLHLVIALLVFLAGVAAWTLIAGQLAERQEPDGGEGREYLLDATNSAGDAKAKPVPQQVLSWAEESRYRALSEFVARRYRVSQEVAFDLVGVAHGAARQLGLDPLLIIAMIAIESRFNPIAESVAGAKGLMQIIPKYHSAKLEEFGGEQAVYDPEANIQVGAQILKEYLRYTGNLGSALQMYAGALGDADDQYTRKVLDEKRRLQQVISPLPNRPVPATTVRTAAAQRGLLAGVELD